MAYTMAAMAAAGCRSKAPATTLSTAMAVKSSPHAADGGGRAPEQGAHGDAEHRQAVFPAPFGPRKPVTRPIIALQERDGDVVVGDRVGDGPGIGKGDAQAEVSGLEGMTLILQALLPRPGPQRLGGELEVLR